MIRGVSLQKWAWIRRFCARMRLMPTLCQEKRSGVWNGVGRCLPNWHRLTSTVKHGDGRWHRGVGLGRPWNVNPYTERHGKLIKHSTESLNQRFSIPVLAYPRCQIMAFSTAWYSSLLRGFPLGTVPGTFLVPPWPRFQAIRTVTKMWRETPLIGRRKSSLLRQTCDTRPNRPARFKSAQPATDRAQPLFKQTHLFVSTKKYLFCCLRKYRRSSRW